MLIPKTPAELRQALQAQQDRYRKMVVLIPSMMPKLKGIFIGGCVERGVGSSFRRQAHAHNSRKDAHFGSVCFRSIKRIGAYTATAGLNGLVEVHIVKPSRTLWHEYAHILTPGHGHDDTWRLKMRELGQPLRKRYSKKSRNA